MRWGLWWRLCRLFWTSPQVLFMPWLPLYRGGWRGSRATIARGSRWSPSQSWSGWRTTCWRTMRTRSWTGRLDSLSDYLRGAVQKIFWANLGFCPNRLDPPPPQTLGHQQLNIFFLCLFRILGYSEHIIFSWKSPIFWVKRVGTGTPPLIWILSQV